MMAFGHGRCTYQHKQFWLPGNGNLVSAWALDGTLVASADSWSQPYRLNLCWHPSGHPGKEAIAAHASALLAELSSSEALCYLTWSPCGGLAAVCIMHEKDDIGHCIRLYNLYVLLPGHPLASMRVRSSRRDSVTWSPAGNRLLVYHSDGAELVTGCCTSVQHFADGLATFSPCGRLLAIVGYDHVALQICMAIDGSQVFRLTGCSIFHNIAKFTASGDVLILAGYHDFRVLCFDWGATASSMYCQQLCRRVAAACQMATTISHSCCDPKCRWT